jgi:glycosyltransferase involved in cell wall biosynthesis
MEEKSPKVSILMGVHNGEKYLSYAIESIIKQTFTDFELVVVDDASTDKTAKILDFYKNKDSRLKIIKNEKNLGLTKSLNIGLYCCKGKYVVRHDDDDVSMEGRIEEQANFLDENPKIVIAGSHFRCIDGDGRFISKVEMKPLKMEAIKLFLAIDNPFVHGGVIFRRSIVMSLGGYNDEYRTNQDIELWSRLLQNHEGANIDKCLVSLRIHGDSISSGNYKNITGIDRKKLKDNLIKLAEKNMADVLPNEKNISGKWIIKYYDLYNGFKKFNLHEIIILNYGFSKILEYINKINYKDRCISRQLLASKFLYIGRYLVRSNNIFFGMIFIMRSIIIVPGGIKKIYNFIIK